MKKAIGLWLIPVLVLSLAVVGCDGYQSPSPATTPEPALSPAPAPTPGGTVHQVTIEDFAFSPAEITIKVGDTVTWTQQDPVTHTVSGASVSSGDLSRVGQTYSKTFDEAGTYSYICNYHPSMRGKIIVE